MGVHDQKVRREHMTCVPCSNGECNKCVDIMRAVLDMGDICQCRKPTHAGEPIHQQIRDPETGTVHAPGLTVDIDGKIVFRERNQHG